MKHVLSVAFIALTLSASAQKVNNKLNFQKGQKLEMVSKVNTTVSMEMMGQSLDTKIDATITRTFDVEDVTSNGATIEHKVKRVQTNLEIPMQGTQTFDSDKESDMKSENGKAMEKALKNKYKMTLNGDGKIATIKADDDNPNKNPSKDEDMMSTAMAQMAAGFDLPKVGDKSEFAILPAKELGKGESWTDTANNIKAVYTVSDITATDVVINYTEEGTTSRKQEAMGQEINMSSKDKTTGKITIDRKSGLLKEKTATTSSEGNMEVGGQSMPMNTKVTKTITVKAS
ncbi:MAG TPA: DUF6263 family protein [Chitinophagaceae bacterium]|nr:DUF6263 family protein [Chitinophagaceae bacterium]